MRSAVEITVEIEAERLYASHLIDNPDYPQIPWSKRTGIVRDAWRDRARKVLYEGTLK